MAKTLRHFGAAARLLWTVSPIVDIARNGWPTKLHDQAIAALQSWRDGDGEETPERKERQFDWVQAIRSACTDSKILPYERQILSCKPMVMGGHEVGTETRYVYRIAAQDFSGWLAAHGEAPSPLVCEWFEHEGVANPAPAPAPTQTAAAPTPVADSASNGPGWSLTKPKRNRGYAAPLYQLLTAAHRDGKPCPTARDVLEAWRTKKPYEIDKVLPDGFDYYDANGNTKTATLEAIRKAIRRMTSAR